MTTDKGHKSHTTHTASEWHITRDECIECGALITEAHPIGVYLPPRKRCHHCLASWWERTRPRKRRAA